MKKRNGNGSSATTSSNRNGDRVAYYDGRKILYSPYLFDSQAIGIEYQLGREKKKYSISFKMAKCLRKKTFSSQTVQLQRNKNFNYLHIYFLKTTSHHLLIFFQQKWEIFKIIYCLVLTYTLTY